MDMLLNEFIFSSKIILSFWYNLIQVLMHKMKWIRSHLSSRSDTFCLLNTCKRNIHWKSLENSSKTWFTVSVSSERKFIFWAVTKLQFQTKLYRSRWKFHLECCHVTNILNQSELIKCGGVTDWVSTDGASNERNPLSYFSSASRSYRRWRSNAKYREVLWRSSRPAHATEIANAIKINFVPFIFHLSRLSM